MKWKLLLLIPLCLTLLSPLTTIAGEPAYRLPINNYPSDVNKNPITKPIPSKIEKVGKGLEPANDASKFSKTKKIVKVGAALKTANHIRRNKWKYAAGAVIVGATAASYYRNDIDRIIDREFYSDKWRSEKKKKLVPILQKKINNAKPEKQDAVIEAIQQSLLYYMVMYDNEPAGKLAVSVLDSLNIMTPLLQSQTQSGINHKAFAMNLLNQKVVELKRDNKRTNCEKGSPRREYILQNQSKDNDVKSEYRLSEWDVDSYQRQSVITENNRKRVNRDKQQYYQFHNDHIPARAPIIVYLEKREHRKLSDIEAKDVKKNATSVAILAERHRKGRTYGDSNKASIAESAANLKASMYFDFIEYYFNYAKDGLNDDTFKRKWLIAFAKTYLRNESLCLFI